jgi:hypothetical protein
LARISSASPCSATKTTADVAYALANLLGGHDPQIAARKLLDEYGGALGIAACLELPWDRDDIAVADATTISTSRSPAS